MEFGSMSYSSNKTSFLRPVLKLHEFWNWECEHWRERLCIYHIQLIIIIRIIRNFLESKDHISHLWKVCGRESNSHIDLPQILASDGGRQGASHSVNVACLLAGSFLLLVSCSVCQKKKETKEDGNGSITGGTMSISSQRLPS